MKALLIIGAVLFILGGIVFLYSFAMNGWSFSGLFTKDTAVSTYDIDEPFTGVEINARTSDIKILPSEDGKCKVVVNADVNADHSVTVENGVLKINATNAKLWHKNILKFLSDEYITVYLPTDTLVSLKTRVTTGDIDIRDGLNLSSVNLKGTTSDIIIKSGASADVEIKTTTGDVSLYGVVTNGKIAVKSTTGDVLFDKCDASEIIAKVTTGNITGSFLTEKNVTAGTTTGKVNVQSTEGGDPCTLKATTGSIKITIVK